MRLGRQWSVAVPRDTRVAQPGGRDDGLCRPPRLPTPQLRPPTPHVRREERFQISWVANKEPERCHGNAGKVAFLLLGRTNAYQPDQRRYEPASTQHVTGLRLVCEEPQTKTEVVQHLIERGVMSKPERGDVGNDDDEGDDGRWWWKRGADRRRGIDRSWMVVGTPTLSSLLNVQMVTLRRP